MIGRGSEVKDEAHFERKLYVIRKIIERAVGQRDDDIRQHFYIASLSSNRVVYKGLFIGTQIRGFYPDLSDPSMSSAFDICAAKAARWSGFGL